MHTPGGTTWGEVRLALPYPPGEHLSTSQSLNIQLYRLQLSFAMRTPTYLLSDTTNPPVDSLPI